ncbi:MAG: MFS transporter [Solobacterium sp.]|nr:MFS transporter [Solobacterium sp.]
MALKNVKHTLYASYLGYITQGIVNNFAPLCFVIFEKEFGLSLSQLTFIITANFLIQLALDYFSTLFIDKIGYRKVIVIAHLLSAMGLVMLTVLPQIIDSYLAILISVMTYAAGGGLIEVLVSPIVEALPLDNKEARMSRLHSFYCFGHIGVIVITTVFFNISGTGSWRLLALLFALIPFINAFYYMVVPVYQLDEENDDKVKSQSTKLLIVFMVLMMASGCSEMAMSQWASFFLEDQLHVSKTVGDLLGPGGFALFMALSRFLHSKYASKLKLEYFMTLSGILCLISYGLAVFSSNAYLSLAGFMLCGFAVGVLWPGTYSLACKYLSVNTASFAFMALAGDVGCTLGPTLTGFVSGLFNDNLKAGILAAGIFPLCIIFIMVWLLNRQKNFK